MKKVSKIIELIKSKKIYYMSFGYFVITILALSPIIISVIAGGLGNCLGCNINEAGTDDCIRWGIPFGNILNPLGVIGWFALLTIPVGVLAFVAWTIYCVVILIGEYTNNEEP